MCTYTPSYAKRLGQPQYLIPILFNSTYTVTFILLQIARKKDVALIKAIYVYLLPICQ